MPPEELTLILRLRDEASKQLSTIGGSLKSIAKVAVAAGAAAGAAIVGVGVAAFKTAADVGEAENVTNLAFKHMADSVRNWASEFAKATGTSKFEAQELASNLGLIFDGMGFTTDASVAMSQSMVELAADMSSAHNIPLADSIEKIRAGLIGSSEPLRSVGVLLSEAAVKQEAYSSGLAEAGAELTEQEKVQARMNLIYQQTTAIQGDLINTQDSAANQYRRLQNRAGDLWKELSLKMMPVLTDVFDIMLTGADYVFGLADRFLSMEAALDGLVPRVIDFFRSNETLQGIMATLTPIAQGVWEVLKALWEVAKPLAQVVGVVLVGALDLAMPALKFVGESLGWLLEKAADGIAVIGRLAKLIQIGESPGLVPALELANTNIRLVSGSIGTELVPRMEDLLTKVQDVTLAYGFFGDELGTKTPMAMGIVNESLLSAPRTAEQVARDLREVAPTWGQSLMDGLKETFNATSVGNTLARAFEGGGGLMGAIKSLASQAGGTLISHVQGALSAAGPWGAIASAAIPLAVGLGKKIWGGIVSAFGGGTNVAEDAYQEIIDASQAASAEDITLHGHMTQALSDGLDERAAAVRAFVQTVRQEQGLSWAEADAEFIRFHEAQADSASKSEKAWAESYAAKLQEDYIAMQAMAENAEATATTAADTAESTAGAWAESFGAQTVASTEMTDEAIANSLRLKDAVVADTEAILAAWTTMANGMQERWMAATDAIADKAKAMAASIASAIMSIPDRTVTVTTRHVTVGGGGGGIASPLSPAPAAPAVNVAAPPVTVVVPQDAVTDSILRNQPRRRALRGI